MIWFFLKFGPDLMLEILLSIYKEDKVPKIEIIFPTLSCIYCV